MQLRRPIPPAEPPPWRPWRALDNLWEPVWDDSPSHRYLTTYYFILTLSGLAAVVVIKNLRPAALRGHVRSWGVAVQRVKRTVMEIERKTFHLCGLLVPLIYQLLLDLGFAHSDCAELCWAITIGGWTADLLRLHVPIVRRNFPMQSLLRAHEMDRLCGACYFSLGCTLSITLFPPAIAQTSIIFVVLGDMSAALIGVSFGRDMCVVKLGREGKKSLEGSAAMFTVCFVVGCSIFSAVRLCEYAVFMGALAATLTELYEPLGVNDNLTVPVISALMLTWGFVRIENCDSGEGTPLVWKTQTP